MKKPIRRELADTELGVDNPLNFAVSARDADVLRMVREAVRHNNCTLAFQPVVQAADMDQVSFYEGLIRVLDASGRVIPARQFMPVAENAPIGRELDRLALAKGCRALSLVPDLRLAVNMSARSIGYRPWMNTLQHWLGKDDSIGPRLILEVTESSAMMVPELVVDFMDRLQSSGICFALDDFGAGFTALRYFKDFFFDIIKIDGQFVRGVSGDTDNQVLTQALTQLGKQFDMVVVAENVESGEDAAYLAAIGVDCLQGYHFGAPRTNPEWLRTARGRERRRA